MVVLRINRSKTGGLGHVVGSAELGHGSLPFRFRLYGRAELTDWTVREGRAEVECVCVPADWWIGHNNYILPVDARHYQGDEYQVREGEVVSIPVKFIRMLD